MLKLCNFTVKYHTMNSTVCMDVQNNPHWDHCYRTLLIIIGILSNAASLVMSWDYLYPFNLKITDHQNVPYF